MQTTIFVCGNVHKCANSIAAAGLTDIQLKALRQWPKKCEACKKTSTWIEQVALFADMTVKPTINQIGGRTNAKSNKDSYRAH